MTAQQWDEAGGHETPDLSPSDQRQVIRRADQLCRRAEPHADEAPCRAHLHEAQRQLFDLVV